MTASHPGEDVLRSLAAPGAKAPPPDAEAREHLAGCRSCRAMVDTLRTLDDAARQGAECPAPERLIEFADASPETRLRSPLQGHLTGCLECAAEVERLVRLDGMSGSVPGASAAPPARSLADRLRALVSFEMPQHIVLATRGAGATETSLPYEQAMHAYRRRRFGEALRGLRRARAEGDATPGLELYLGACLIDAQRSGEAVDAFQAAVRARPRLAEYRWYLAQALLLEGRGPDALEQLEKAAIGKGPHRDDARDLGARLRELLKER